MYEYLLLLPRNRLFVVSIYANTYYKKCQKSSWYLSYFCNLTTTKKQSLGEFWTPSCFPTRINRNLISEAKTANIVKSKDHKVVKNMGTI